MKILLTGATGLLGREVMGQLLDEGHDVSVIVRGKASGLDERVTKIELGVAKDADDARGVVYVCAKAVRAKVSGGVCAWLCWDRCLVFF